MSLDLYSDAGKLAKRLRAEELPDWGDKIEDAIRCGSTGTEILMAVRWQCRQLIEQEPSLTQEARSLAEILVSEINTLLGN